MNFTYDPGTAVVLVGLSGAGKSFFAQRRWPATWRLNLDTYRAMATDSEADQSATPVAAQIQDLLLDARLSRGLTTIVDSTGLLPHVRAHLLARARYWQRPAAAVLFDVSLDLCRRQNTGRTRVVPDHVLAEQHRHLPTADQLLVEGFRFVDRITTASPAYLEPAHAR
ncbi:AAA family ATPase [Streptomyces kaniharaensis]|uniref:AAA family ATPase n=1 Tax=Streptomyces kaniharaensis TaxID=212423 RepID=A0A6N7L212_9ACTN|nr:AAA family ATPase [Streptomyces kaniharaensis]MQS17882.1 AAA family ATPase [Streptomyces kaniharaensis]